MPYENNTTFSIKFVNLQCNHSVCNNQNQTVEMKIIDFTQWSYRKQMYSNVMLDNFGCSNNSYTL